MTKLLLTLALHELIEECLKKDFRQKCLGGFSWFYATNIHIMVAKDAITNISYCLKELILIFQKHCPTYFLKIYHN